MASQKKTKLTLCGKEFYLLFCLLLGTGSTLINQSAKAESNNDTTSSTASDDVPNNGMTDWHLIPAGGGGDWRTAVGRTQSNPKKINEIKDEDNPLLPRPEHFFGSWGGLNTWLYRHGINLNIENQNEFEANVTGGIRRGATNAGALNENLDIDWATLVGRNAITDGLLSHMTVIGRYGNLANKAVGENITSVQEVYGAGGNVAAKLVNLYLDKYSWGGKIVTSFGRTNVSGFYAISPIYCYFVNNGICGNPKAVNADVGGFNAWPDSAWGITSLIRPVQQMYIRVGLFQTSRAVFGNAAGHRAGWAAVVSTAEDAGAEIPIEAGYEPHWGKHDLLGHYKVGFAYDTSPFPVWGEGVNGGREFKYKGPNQHWKAGRAMEYILLDQMIHRNAPGNLSGLITYAGWVRNDPNTCMRQNELYAGVIDTGFWKARPLDAFGVLFIQQMMSRKLRNLERYMYATGLPISDISDGATGIQSAESTVELTYIIHVVRGMRFQPDFQYEIHPNAQKNINDAAFFGFKTYINF
ncbi:Porin B [Commensalibacter sp. Nvir]|uniref:carbohydrate porin n=1 Tax=Commensalibacter sp. Nvir TaxID=3069817 RepID=UPI002D4A9528|nr:Porin B [Commensalibacter sp. Nvir]